MSTVWLPRVPAKLKTDAVLVLLVLVGGAAAFCGGLLAHAPTFTRTVRVERSWGTPSQSVPGAQVNRALTGMTCDVYNSRKTVVCHP